MVFVRVKKNAKKLIYYECRHNIYYFSYNKLLASLRSYFGIYDYDNRHIVLQLVVSPTGRHSKQIRFCFTHKFFAEKRKFVPHGNRD